MLYILDVTENDVGWHTWCDMGARIVRNHKSLIQVVWHEYKNSLAEHGQGRRESCRAPAPRIRAFGRALAWYPAHLFRG